MKVKSLKYNRWYLDLLYFINVFLQVKNIEPNEVMMGYLGYQSVFFFSSKMGKPSFMRAVKL